MANPVKPIPDGYRAIAPSLICGNAAAAIEFYKKAFGAQEIMRMPAPGGKISHAELKIGDSAFMLSDEFPGRAIPPNPNALPSSELFLYVTDADTTFNRALEAGAKSEMPIQDMFWGDRYTPPRPAWARLLRLQCLCTQTGPVRPAQRCRG